MRQRKRQGGKKVKKDGYEMKSKYSLLKKERSDNRVDNKREKFKKIRKSKRQRKGQKIRQRKKKRIRRRKEVGFGKGKKINDKKKKH